jgi:hypothetical protein
VEALCNSLREVAVLCYTRTQFPDLASKQQQEAPEGGLQRLDTCGASEALVGGMGIAAGRYMPLGHSAWRW